MPELHDLQAALAGLDRHMAERAGSPALKSLTEQLEYLIAYAQGENDGEALAGINVGVIAARGIEDVDQELASILYRIQVNTLRAVSGSRNA
jgi:hypothetical protein